MVCRRLCWSRSTLGNVAQDRGLLPRFLEVSPLRGQVPSGRDPKAEEHSHCLTAFL